ncbi:hypothetical protein M0R45_028336 [Rubus argutus]|uniref:Glycosyl transferase family 28 C-terminal domain-containing protein n=1 Tax=Rubus argutus TaxID=59490 RepID=A0AAW1W8T8_RUBAR
MGDSEVTVKSKKTVFVTVGTTCFDALVKVVDTQEVKEELSRRGYNELLIQMGRGSYIPQSNVIGEGMINLMGRDSKGGDESIAVDYFTFSSSIADHLRAASLVISHAGSGSIFETLRLGKPLIVVTLKQIISDVKVESLIPYHPGDATPVAKLINRFLGFSED